jgi:hypothetical protein
VVGAGAGGVAGGDDGPATPAVITPGTVSVTWGTTGGTTEFGPVTGGLSSRTRDRLIADGKKSSEDTSAIGVSIGNRRPSVSTASPRGSIGTANFEWKKAVSPARRVTFGCHCISNMCGRPFMSKDRRTRSGVVGS